MHRPAQLRFPPSGLRRLARGALGGLPLLLAAIAGPRAGCSDEPVPGLRAQLAAARQAEDQPAIAEICRRLLGENPGDADLQAARINALLATRDWERARVAVQAANALAPAAREELRGDLARAEDRPGEALAAWRAALDARPAGPASCLEKIATLHATRGEWTEAAARWRQLLALPGADSAARRTRLALALLNLGRVEEAGREIRAANALDASDAELKAALPRFERLRPQLPLLRSLGAKLDQPPANPLPDNNVAPGAGTRPALLLDRARIFYAAGVFIPALADALAAREAAPESRAALVLAGQCFWQLGRDEEAAQQRVVRVADRQWAAGDRAAFERLRAADAAVAANAPNARARRAVELLAADQPALVLPDAEAAVKDNPRSADAAVLLAAALLRNDRPAEALAAARRATELDTRSADAWAMLGRLEQEARADLPAAARALSRALAIREDPRWLSRREFCLRATGQTVEAERDHRRLAQLRPPASL